MGVECPQELCSSRGRQGTTLRVDLEKLFPHKVFEETLYGLSIDIKWVLIIAKLCVLMKRTSVVRVS